MKLTKEQINKIRNLNNEGLKQMEIANQLGISQKTVSYWLSDENKRKEIIQKACKAFKSKSLSERQRIYKRRLPYLRNYQRKRYNEDKEFRERKLIEVKKAYKKKKKEKKDGD